jgi:galactose mutarotase-like enzyme
MRIAAGPLTADVGHDEHLTITSLTHRGQELLLAPQEVPERFRVHRVAAGITLLHPWANRLPDRPIHGLAAAPGDWQVKRPGPDHVHAVLDFAGVPDFPYPHHLAVDVRLTHDALELDVHLTGPEPVPLALGWHPYLRLPGTPSDEWVLTQPAREALELDERGLPVDPDAGRPLPAERAPLGERSFDDALAGIADGAAFAIADARRTVTVRHLKGFPAAQLFRPAGHDLVSLEPMAAPTGALAAGRAPTAREATLRCAVEIADVVRAP